MMVNLKIIHIIQSLEYERGIAQECCESELGK